MSARVNEPDKVIKGSEKREGSGVCGGGSRPGPPRMAGAPKRHRGEEQ